VALSGGNFYSSGRRMPEREAEANGVKKLFELYSTGNMTLNSVAEWLNDEGLRTQNTRKLPGPDGTVMHGPRLFTHASVRGILNNSFFAGLVKHRDSLHPGLHDALVSKEMSDIVQDKLRANSGRSETLDPRPERQYLMKGIIRCAYCLMPMWAQTYKNGRRYYL